jgi:hypothetical protein
LSEHLVTQVGLASLTPNILKFGQDVTVTFSYDTTEVGGVRIWARLFTGQNLTPNYAACGLPVYPVGSGTGSCSFTLTGGNVTVNKIRLQMWTENQSALLFQTFLPVRYKFR